MNTKYLNFHNEAQRLIAECAFEEAKSLLPWWCAVAQIHLSGDNDNDTADVEPLEEYRRTLISLYSAFFSLDVEEQVACLQHECAHALIARFTEPVFARLIEPLKEENPELYAYVNADMTDRMEAVVEDIVATWRKDQNSIDG